MDNAKFTEISDPHTKNFAIAIVKKLVEHVNIYADKLKMIEQTT